MFSVSSYELTDENEDTAAPPWPEWNEEQLNAKHWNVIRSRRHPHVPGYESVVWRQMEEIFPGETCQMTNKNHTSFLLQENVFHLNKHLMKQDLFRTMLYSLKNLSFINYIDPTHGPMTNIGPSESAWHPAQHIYPQQYSPRDRYAVKLFYFGKWRKIVVDCHFPYDEITQTLLIPFIDLSQMWLPILCKAILIVASLEDFDWRKSKVSCMLTGYFSYIVDRKELCSEDLWNMIDGNVRHAKEDSNTSKDEEDTRNLSKENLGTSKKNLIAVEDKMKEKQGTSKNKLNAVEDKMKKDNVKKENEDKDNVDKENVYETYVLAGINSEGIPKLHTTNNVTVEVVLHKCYLRTYAKHWKETRYNKWAYEKGKIKWAYEKEKITSPCEEEDED